MKIKFIFYIYCIVCFSCNNREGNSIQKETDTAIVDTTYTTIKDTPSIEQSTIKTVDTVGAKSSPKTIKPRSTPVEKAIEMPKPGVSDRDKRIIDSIKQARRKLKE